MKAYSIYKKTLSLMFENDGEDKAFYNNFCPVLSSVATECLPYENALRRAQGSEEYKGVPSITDMEQELDMSDELCSYAIPYGVAEHFCRDDGEVYNSSLFRERFVNALNDARKCVFGDVSDVYGGENI